MEINFLFNYANNIENGYCCDNNFSKQFIPFFAFIVSGSWDKISSSFINFFPAFVDDFYDSTEGRTRSQ